MIFDSIVNRGEFLSNHYLDALVQEDLKGLRQRWNAREDQHEQTPRTLLRSLGRDFFATKRRVADARNGARPADMAALNRLTLRALGFDPPGEGTEPLTATRGDDEIAVPAAAAADSSSGPQVVALGLGFASDVDEVFAPEGAGLLLEPLSARDGRETVDRADHAVNRLFACDDPPRYILLVAGSVVLLADRHFWTEGRFLAVNLELALERADTKAKGELETIAALFSSDALLPVDGQTLLDELTQNSVKHAQGVSKGLREAVRYSVEIIANEVIAQRRGNGLPVEGEPGLADTLTRQSLRFLYRLLFLLYAETRPELAILPVNAPEYQEGYGLDRIRDLVLVELPSQRSRDGYHFYESLRLLFELVNEGHNYEAPATSDGTGTASDNTVAASKDDVGLVFEPLRSDLFASSATPLIDEVRLRNAALQRVLRLLLLSPERRGSDRGFVSYAQLGINQLGAVYEGLMAYTGFLADEPLYEVAKNGDPHKGTWVVPERRAGEYDDKHFVVRRDPLTGEDSRVRHETGSFVFRLSGRDRQRSASYYTPEALTSCVVEHALAEWKLAQGEELRAQHLLEMTICEPALGSGAFLNEAINQVARTYLEMRQRELGTQLGPEEYALELQKVKAHLALHQCYGVDLNGTAIELAEVSLWLNAMHPGLQAPWFGLHLRRGNSLVGARRAAYAPDQLAKKAWLSTPPTERHLRDGGIGDNEIHHFLLPAHGWGAVGDAKQAKELRPDEAKTLRDWRKRTQKAPSKADTKRLSALGRRVERLWALALRRLEISESEVRRDINVWGVGRLPSSSGAVTREQVEQGLYDEESPLQRLRLVMDAWCALWFWPLDGEHQPPEMAEWLDTLEELLGFDPKVDRRGGDRFGLFGDINTFDEITEADQAERSLCQMTPTAKAVDRHPWLETVRDIAEREGFFHWELFYGQIFHRGGFDLQIGNPPWVRLDWEEDTVLAEHDPFFRLQDKIPQQTFRDRRAVVLSHSEAQDAYVDELAAWAGLTESLGSASEHPALDGLRTNLYMNFMERTWRSMALTGMIGLLHPESHFTDPKAGPLRTETYERLRLYANFTTANRWFEGVDSPTQTFGIHCYGAKKHNPGFAMVTNLQAIETLDLSLSHDGSGEVPGKFFADGLRDLRPHKSRVMPVGEQTLEAWAALFDEPGTPSKQARLLRPLTVEQLAALSTLASNSLRMADTGYRSSSGWNEKNAKDDGFILWRTEVPSSWGEAILQGPHFTVSTPFAKEPNENCRSKGDYSDWGLEELPEQVIPRTNYQRACSEDEYRAGLDRWDGEPFTNRWRVAWRRMTQPGSERSLHAALIPPGPAHVDAVHSLALPTHRENTLVAGLWASLTMDYLVKVSGISDVRTNYVDRFPVPVDHPAAPNLLLRSLRLNCLTRDYAPLWEELYEAGFRDDAWTPAFADRPALGAVDPEWTMSTPLRTDYDRRAALVEIDALAALMLGLTAEQLCAIYRAQFAVLRKYEYQMFFDANGRKIAKSHHAAGVKQERGDYELVSQWVEEPGSVELPDRYTPPFVRPDREKEMTQAYEEFARRLGLDTAPPAAAEQRVAE